MSISKSQGIDILANLLIIIVSIFAIAFYAMQMLPSSSPPTIPDKRNFVGPNRPRSPVPGLQLALQGVNWQSHDRTLLLVLSTSCRFCADSAPFYRGLLAVAHENPRIRLIAFLPQTPGEAVHYLRGLNLDIESIQVQPAAIGVSSTPTLILVDKSGKVTHTWMGALRPQHESNVIDRFIGSESRH